jgi:hypothetical protein
LLSERQKQSLLDVYQAFRTVAENANNTALLEPTPLFEAPGLETTIQGDSHG